MIQFVPLGSIGVDPPPNVLQLGALSIDSSDVDGFQSVLVLGEITTESLLSSELSLQPIEVLGFASSDWYGVVQLAPFVVSSGPDLPIPVLGVGFISLLPLAIDALVTEISYGGDNNLQLRPLTIVGAAFDSGVGYAAAELNPLLLSGSAPIDYTNSILTEMYFYAYMSAGTTYNAIESDIAFSSGITGDHVKVLIDALHFDGSASAPVVYNITLSEMFSARDALAVVFDVALADSVVLTDLPGHSWCIYAALADLLTCTGISSSHLNSITTAASALVLRDIIALVYENALNDPLVLSEAAASNLDYLIQILDSVAFADLGTSGLFMTAMLDETVEFDDTPTTQALFNLLLNESVTFTSRLRIFGEDYVGYVMNTRTRGVTQYQGYNFNSFAELDGKYYGANDEGLYLLEGDTDDSALISAHIRTGLTDFGTQLKKQVHDAYIGYTTDGRLLLKVITTDAGARKENWYALNAKEIEASSDNRFRISKGLKSVYWQFEVANVDGADFDISNMTVWPFVLHRRK